jgi:RHS repeat-associated protein
MFCGRAALNYYSFGMEMVGRKYTANEDYRYGFNGKELDEETETLDYGMRVYDPRLGKFLSVDPLADEYPALSPYHFSHNSPIKFNDLDGNEGDEAGLAEKAIKEITKISKTTQSDLAKKALQQVKSGGIQLVKTAPKTKWFTVLFRGSGVWFTRVNIFITFMSFRGDERASQETLNKERLEKLERLYEEGAIDEDEANELRGLLAKVRGLYLSDLGVYYKKKLFKDRHGNNVEDRIVDTDDDLLKIGIEYITKFKMKLFKKSEDGSEWYEGVDENGNKIQMEYSPKGHPHMGETPHVKINKWNKNKGRKGKGGYQVSHKYKVDTSPNGTGGSW